MKKEEKGWRVGTAPDIGAMFGIAYERSRKANVWEIASFSPLPSGVAFNGDKHEDRGTTEEVYVYHIGDGTS